MAVPSEIPPVDLPLALCRRMDFPAVSADPECSVWRSAVSMPLRLNIGGGRPLQATDVRVGWSADGLRVLFVAEDAHPWATLTEHDAPLYKEEVFEVFLDPEGDGDGYFELEVNPNNAVLDGAMRRVRSGFRKDFRWHCEGLQTAVRFLPGGWAAELSIPFASVCGEPPQIGQRWRVNFTRIDRPPSAPRELSAWSPTGYAQFHMPGRFGFLEFCGA